MNWSMNVRAVRGAFAAVVLAVGAPALAQQPPAAPPATSTAPAPPSDAMQVQQELITIQQRLVAAEQKVMQDPAMQAMQNELQQKVEKEVKRIEPTYDAKIERIGEIQGSLAQAQQAGDQAKVQQLVTEGKQIQQQLETAQNQVLQGEQVAAQIEAFQTKLHQKMIEVEPETDKLVERANVLVAKLQRAP